MIDRRREPERRGRKGEVLGELHLRLEKPSVVDRLLVQHHHPDVPQKDVRVVLQLDVETRNRLLRVC